MLQNVARQALPDAGPGPAVAPGDGQPKSILLGVTCHLGPARGIAGHPQPFSKIRMPCPNRYPITSGQGVDLRTKRSEGALKGRVYHPIKALDLLETRQFAKQA